MEDFRLAVASVSLGPSLRAWSLAGVTHLLCDVPAAELLAEAAAAQRAVANPAVLQPGGTPRQSGGVSNVTPTPKTKPFVPPKRREAGTAPSVAESASQEEALPFVFAPRKGVPSETAQWPAPWGECVEKSQGAPILWTYHELGADLTGVGRSAERSAFFRALLGELRLPKGSSVFWPCAMPDPQNGELVSNAPVFAAGMVRLFPQLVVVFGENALTDIGLGGRCGYFHQRMVEGKLLVVLPEIEELLCGAAQRSSAVSLLRAVVASVNLG